jgi:serine/threonine protein kinase
MRVCPKCGSQFTSGETVCSRDGSSLQEAPAAEERPIGTVLAGKYRIEGFLKRGGMGAVYRATHVMLQKQVAIKLIKPELVTSQDTVERFHREARAASQLDHPNIVTVHDLGQAEDGTLYIAMELVPGRSLKELVKKEGPLRPERAVWLAKGICSALALAHRNHIIHRDLKPQNIMVFQDSDGQEQPKLLDFGIAKTFESQGPALTSTGLVLGTPHYMAPEQAKGVPVDARSDLYALGIILYEMLVGKVPFDDKSIPAILVKHLNEQPRPLSQLRPGLAPALEAIVLRCLEKEPGSRYQSAQELSETLAAAETELASARTAPGLPPIPSTPTKVSTPAASTMAGMAGMAGARTRSTQPTVPVPERPTTRAPVARKTRRLGWAIALAIAAVLLIGLVGIAVVTQGDHLSRRIASLLGTASEEPAATDEPTDVTPAVAPPEGEPAAIESVSSESETTPREAPPQRPPVPSPPAEADTSPAASAVPTSGGEAAPLPADPPVHVRCEGLSDACAALRSALQEAFGSADIPTGGLAEAEILIDVYTEEIDSRSEEQFGTTFVVRTYSIEVTGEVPRFGEDVTMPSPEVFSFDARFGREKLNERSRVVANAVTRRIRDYWSERAH